MPEIFDKLEWPVETDNSFGDSLEESKHKNNINQFDFANSLQESVIEMREKQISNYKKLLADRLSQDIINELESIGFFNPENIALSENYISSGADFHGDIFALYGFLVLTGYLLPTKDQYFIMNFGTGEVIFDSRNPENKLSIQEIINSDANKNKELVILPAFDINKNFAGKIKLLGDYINRGPESAMCVALLDYLTQQKNYDKHLDVHIGNHETIFSCGLYSYNKTGNSGSLAKYIKPYEKAIDRMKKENRLTLQSLEKLDNDKYVSYLHVRLSKNYISKMLSVIKKLGALDKFAYKQEEPYKTHLENYNRLLENEKYKDLASKINEYIKSDKNDFDDKDYFDLRSFVFEVVGEFNNDSRGFYKPDFTSSKFCVRDEQKIDKDDYFKDISQLRGHFPSVAFGLSERQIINMGGYNIFDLDTLRGIASGNPNNSDALVTIQCPDENDNGFSFLLEDYFIERGSNLSLDKNKVKSRQTFMNVAEDPQVVKDYEVEYKVKYKVKKKNNAGDKKFNSLKKYLAAYSASFWQKQNDFKSSKKIFETLKKVFYLLGKKKNLSDQEIDKKFNILFKTQIKKLEALEQAELERAQKEKNEKERQEQEKKIEAEKKEAESKAKEKAEKEKVEAEIKIREKQDQEKKEREDYSKFLAQDNFEDDEAKKFKSYLEKLKADKKTDEYKECLNELADKVVKIYEAAQNAKNKEDINPIRKKLKACVKTIPNLNLESENELISEIDSEPNIFRVILQVFISIIRVISLLGLIYYEKDRVFSPRVKLLIKKLLNSENEIRKLVGAPPRLKPEPKKKSKNNKTKT